MACLTFDVRASSAHVEWCHSDINTLWPGHKIWHSLELETHGNLLVFTCQYEKRIPWLWINWDFSFSVSFIKIITFKSNDHFIMNWQILLSQALKNWSPCHLSFMSVALKNRMETYSAARYLSFSYGDHRYGGIAVIYDHDNYTPRTTKLLGGYTGFTPSVRPSVRLSVRPSVRPSRMPCPLCIIYSYGWILFILGTNDHCHERVCRAPWPLTLTYIFKVIWPWLRKSCPLCSVYSSGWILSIFGTNDHYH